MSENRSAILVVDDEAAIRRYLQTILTSEGYDVIEARDGSEALRTVSQSRVDVMILDLGLPDIEGVEVARQVRQWTEIPIIILSVKDREKDKIAALDAGADDYLTKPFGTGELLARVRAALRRSSRASVSQPLFQLESLQVDLDRRLVTVNQQEIPLTPNEYDLLALMVRNAGRVLTHRYLLEKVWGIEYVQESHLLRVNISNLRRKIEADPSRPRVIVTEPGVGYRLRTT